MKKIAYALLLALSVATLASAQGSLSNQVLRLLSRENTWSALNTYTAGSGIVLLGRQSVPLGTRTDRLENIGGNLYFNGSLLTSSASSGTVTSVALSVPAFLSVSGSPITSSGTLAVTLATQNANRIFAGPTTGSAATPTFRALVAADIPDISAIYLTPSSSATLTNKAGNISQWTNDSGYLTSATSGSTSITTLGTIVTGTWNATVITGQYGGTGVANTGKTITLGGNLTTSGANNVTFTTSGATSVTLPTSGTLITTAVATLSSLTSIGTIGTGTWQATAIGVIYGGTGLTSATQGDIIYASGANTWAKLAKSTSSTRALCNTGSSNNPAWCQIDLTSGVTGVLPAANGGLGVSTAAITDGQLLIGKTSDHSLNLAAITGTANQITVTNGGGTITLSTPQSIGTGSTPQFARIGLGTGAGASAVITTTGQFDTGYYANGSSGATPTVSWNNGMVQKITLTAGATVTFTNPISGVSTYRLDLTQDGTGSRLVTWPGSVVWQGGAAPTLTTTAGKTDICWFMYNGSTYYGYCSLNY